MPFFFPLTSRDVAGRAARPAKAQKRVQRPIRMSLPFPSCRIAPADLILHGSFGRVHARGYVAKELCGHKVRPLANRTFTDRRLRLAVRSAYTHTMPPLFLPALSPPTASFSHRLLFFSPSVAPQPLCPSATQNLRSMNYSGMNKSESKS